jgi:hypothetical protein
MHLLKTTRPISFLILKARYPNLAFSVIGATEEIYPALKINGLPWYIRFENDQKFTFKINLSVSETASVKLPS